MPYDIWMEQETEYFFICNWRDKYRNRSCKQTNNRNIIYENSQITPLSETLKSLFYFGIIWEISHSFCKNQNGKAASVCFLSARAVLHFIKLLSIHEWVCSAACSAQWSAADAALTLHIKSLQRCQAPCLEPPFKMRSFDSLTNSSDAVQKEFGFRRGNPQSSQLCMAALCDITTCSFPILPTNFLRKRSKAVSSCLVGC